MQIFTFFRLLSQRPPTPRPTDDSIPETPLSGSGEMRALVTSNDNKRCVVRTEISTISAFRSNQFRSNAGARRRHAAVPLGIGCRRHCRLGRGPRRSYQRRRTSVFGTRFNTVFAAK